MIIKHRKDFIWQRVREDNTEGVGEKNLRVLEKNIYGKYVILFLLTNILCGDIPFRLVTRSLTVCIMSDCGPLFLLLSAIGGSFPDNN